MDDLLEQYSGIKSIFDGLDYKQQDELKDKLNAFHNCIGDTFFEKGAEEFGKVANSWEDQEL